MTVGLATRSVMPKSLVLAPPDCAARGHGSGDTQPSSAPRRANLTGALAKEELMPTIFVPERPE